ncbi:hypothetical protein, partial [Jatrophihabitans endophyticus]|uniref:hypothetical protein n=1 Tax=Jatrophihabitans endophyticus TaxID=1206085 RepID=UPI001A00ABEB
MPKNASEKTAASTPETGADAAASAVSDSAAIDLLDELTIGTRDLEPQPVRLRGIEFSVRRFYPAEEVWQISDIQQRHLPNLAAARQQMVDTFEHLLPAEDHGYVEDLVALFEDRPRGEVDRYFAKLFR